MWKENLGLGLNQSQVLLVMERLEGRLLEVDHPSESLDNLNHTLNVGGQDGRVSQQQVVYMSHDTNALRF